MATDFGDQLRGRWAAGEPAFGAWCVLPGALPAEVLARCGFDWACVDLQHGLAGLETAPAMLQAISLSGIPPLVRVPGNEPWLIGRALDLGAAGVIVPLVSSPEEAARAATACRYPPVGNRSFGPLRASSPERSDPAYANGQVLCIVMIETREGVDSLPAICTVDGVDAVYVGPRDLALSHGLTPGPELDELIGRILATCRDLGVPAGIQTRSGEAARGYANAGFLFAGIASDRELLAEAAVRELTVARGAEPAPRTPADPTLRAVSSSLGR